MKKDHPDDAKEEQMNRKEQERKRQNKEEEQRRTLVCENCSGEGHTEATCIVPPRRPRKR